MFQCIVVPLDGSKLAEQVLPYAASMAKSFGARIQLVQVVASSSQLSSMGMMGAGDAGGAPRDFAALEAALTAEVSHTRTYLEKIATDLRKNSVQVDWEVRRGVAAMEIAGCARQHQADLIAISTHGRGGLARLLFGSVADRVLREAGIPVLLVPPTEGTS